MQYNVFFQRFFSFCKVANPELLPGQLPKILGLKIYIAHKTTWLALWM